MGDANLSSDLQPHKGKQVIVTADNSLHPITKKEILVLVKLKVCLSRMSITFHT